MLRAEVLAEHVHVEVGERARPREPVDVFGREPGVGDLAFGRLDPDLAAVRPDAFVYSVSPIPAMATSPRTSSKSEA